MRLVVTDALQKNKLLNTINVEVAGKTGTAQEGEDRPAHALFISYAPYSAPEVSVTTVIPNGYASSNAADLTGFIYAYLYDKEALNNAEFTKDNGEVGD
jgi:penicillin-binding protein 2